MAIFNLEMVTFLTCSSAKTRSPVFAWALLMGETMTSRSNLDQDHTVFDDLWCSGRFTHVYTPQVVHNWPVAKVEQSQQHRGEELDEKLQWDKLFHALRSGSNSWKTGTDILPISSPSVLLYEEYWRGSGAPCFHQARMPKLQRLIATRCKLLGDPGYHHLW